MPLSCAQAQPERRRRKRPVRIVSAKVQQISGRRKAGCAERWKSGGVVCGRCVFALYLALRVFGSNGRASGVYADSRRISVGSGRFGSVSVSGVAGGCDGAPAFGSALDAAQSFHV